MNLDRRLFMGKVLSGIVYPEYFPLHASENVVNLGCGVGPQLKTYQGSYKHMACVDLLQDRLDQLRAFAQEEGINETAYETHCVPVEQTGLQANGFEKALCIDIIEHLNNPGAMLTEIHRLLKPGGRALVTIPMMHDHVTHLLRSIGKILGRKTSERLPEGHPDRHNTSLSRRQWMKVFEASPLKLVGAKATTLFPPLHLYGIPRFWFRVRAIHAVDRFLCSVPFLNRLGQSWMCILEKPSA